MMLKMHLTNDVSPSLLQCRKHPNNVEKQIYQNAFKHRSWTHKHIHTHKTVTSLSLPEFDSVSLVPATALWSVWTVCGESVFGTETMVPSSDTWDFSVSLSMPVEKTPNMNYRKPISDHHLAVNKSHKKGCSQEWLDSSDDCCFIYS